MSLFSGIGEYFGSSPNSKKPPTEDDKNLEPPKIVPVKKSGTSETTDDLIKRAAGVLTHLSKKIERGVLLSGEEKKDFENVLKFYSSIKIPVTQTRLMEVYNGSGANGKGLLLHMLKQALGAYYDDMDINYLTQKENNARGADPVMASKKNSRLCISTEPEGGCEINDGIVKKISGSDGVSCRHLYGKPFSFTPKFKLHIQTNCLFKIDGGDGGNARRYIIIPFNSKFVDEPVRPNEKKINKNLKSEIKTPKFNNAFMQILIRYYSKYLSEGIKLPKIFKAKTQEFLNDNDPIGEFVPARIRKTNNSKDRIPSRALYTSFTEYFKFTKINETKFKQGLVNLGFETKAFTRGAFWMNVKTICMDEADADEAGNELDEE